MKSKVKMEKQYGLVHKEVLQNRDISANAKGLYTYLAARSGNKYTCNPTVATILKDLGICEATFHTLKNELITKGVIEVVKTGSGINKRNNYNLLVKSNKGYGYVYLDLLKDSKISLKAKAIYGLLASYSGTDFITFPFAYTIFELLKMGRNTYFKAMQALKDKKYIYTKQRRINGRFSHCYYYINGVKPSKEEKTKTTTTTAKTNKGEKVSSSTEYSKYADFVKDNIEYNSLQKLYENNEKANYLLENILSLLVNNIYFETKALKVNGLEVTGGAITSIFNKLKFNHIKKVVENVIAVENKIKNIREYLKVALYNIYFQMEQENYNKLNR